MPQSRCESRFPGPVRRPAGSAAGGAGGFTMIELLIAIVVLLVGVVAVAQLIPAAIESNFRNRYDSTAMIIAQRQLEQMIAEDMVAPISPPVAVGADWFFTVLRADGTTFTCNIGLNDPADVANDPAQTTTGAGANLVTLPDGTLVVNWTQAGGAVPVGYRDVVTIAGATAAESYQYETRWNVKTYYQTFNAVQVPVGKRILISTRGGPPGVAAPPTTLMALVSMKR